MRTGHSISEMVTIANEMDEVKEDFIVNKDDLNFKVDVDLEENLIVPKMEIMGNEYGLDDNFTNQLCNKLHLPVKYYDYLLEEDRSLLEKNVNELLDKREGNHNLIRTMNGNARAFLSTSYKCMDHSEVLEVVLPALGQHLEIDNFKECYISPNKMTVTASIPLKTFEPNVGDICEFGIEISNSEIGTNQLMIAPFLYRLVCTNGMRVRDRAFGMVGIRHKGIDLVADDISSRKFLKEEHVIQQGKEQWLVTVEDKVDGFFNGETIEYLGEVITKSAESASVNDTDKALVRLGKEYGIGDKEQQEIGIHFNNDKDLTRWGLANAVTRYAQDANTSDRTEELEQIGWNLTKLNDTDWKRLYVN